MAALAAILFLDVQAQGNISTGAGGERSFAAGEISRYQGEQVARLLERVVPRCVMAAIGKCALVGQIAVRQEHRVPPAVGYDGGGIDRQHIGAVGEIGDGAESLRLALGAEHPGRAIQALQESVVLRAELCRDFQRECRRHRRYGELFGVGSVPVRRQLFAIENHSEEHETVTVQNERLLFTGGVRVCPDRKA